jgi:hypothetical protein
MPYQSYHQPKSLSRKEFFMARSLTALHTKVLVEASSRPLDPSGDTVLADGSRISARVMTHLRDKGWLTLGWKGYTTSRAGQLALSGYAPTLGEAGFMDLLMTLLERADQRKFWPRSPSAEQVEALEDSRAAAMRYLVAVEGKPLVT